MAASQRNTSSAAGAKNSTLKGRKPSGSSKSRKNARGQTSKKMDTKEAEYYDEIILILSLVISLLLILSNFNLSGKVGAAVNRLSFGIFGFLAYLVPYLLFLGTSFYISNRRNRIVKRKFISSVILFIVLTGFIQLMTKSYLPAMKLADYFKESALEKKGGGLIGGMVVKLFCPLFDIWGTYIILLAAVFILIMFITEKLIFSALGKTSGRTLKTMKEKHREYIEAREEMELQYEEDEDYNEYSETTRKKAKTFTFKKPHKDNSGSDDILTHKEESLSKKDKNSTGIGKDSYNMNEFIPTDFDHLSIQRGDNFASREEGAEIFEEELRNKFKGSQDYDIKKLADHVMQESHNGYTQIPAKQESLSNIPPLDTKSSSKVHQEPVMDLNTFNEASISEFFDSDSEFNEINDLGADVSEIALSSDLDYIPDNSLGLDELPQIDNKNISDTLSQSNEGKGTLSDSISDALTSAKGAETSMNVPIPKVVSMPAPEYKFPPISLLSKPKTDTKGMSNRELKETAMKLQKTLESFGVRVTITNVSCGPAVTRYELQPEQGVKVSKITNLADDIKLNLAAADIRIEAPIPGKAAVGIEVPNKENTAVMFRELLESKEFKSHSSNISFAVGKDIGGQTIVTDIARMPHLLIAGATGSGKSVCINTLIMSILYKADPADVKLIMVDPKVVELSVYNGIPHLLIPVVTDPKKASAALNWAVMEMTERYNKFAELGVRDIKCYNDKIKTVEEYKDERYQKMPQIVIIVDELADLMMVAPGEVEDAICRLAQMARAAGLHLIIATQRPSVNVITGLIKANVPSRIAFSVSSAIDSRTIIDGAGAEKLLGKGDMLFFPSGYPKPVRIQGAFVSDKEVSRVVEFLTAQNSQPQYSEEVANRIVNAQTADNSVNTASVRDDYFIEAAKFIIEKDKASIGMLQRVYKIGFNRAARIMDQLSEAGVVGPEEGTKPRKVIMSMEEFEQFVDEYV